jgi:magnesium chelatase family protein
MALFRTATAALFGIEARPIDVEVDLYAGGSSRDFIMVGMPDAAVRESRERIKSALGNSGFGYPTRALTVNLAPANLRKEGAGFDLPMALAILGAMGTVASSAGHMVVGELSLDGGLRPVRGALPIAACARRQGIRRLVVPRENAAEAAVVDGLEVFGLSHLSEVVALLAQPASFTPHQTSWSAGAAPAADIPDFADVRG